LLALLGTALPVFALGQGCDCTLRPWLVLLGVLLCFPLGLFEALWRLRARRWVLWRLVAGDYAVDVQEQPLPCPWAPSKTTFSQGQVKAAELEAAFVSYGQWYRCPLPSPGANIERSAAKAALPDGSQKSRFISVTCSSRSWTNASASIEASGCLVGLGDGANFDGNTLTWTSSAGGQVKTWRKRGWLRLDSVYKTLVTLAGLGLLMALVAVLFHPGLTTDCGPKTTENKRLVKTPMRAVFLVDASSSVNTADFASEKSATEAIIDAFQEVYRPDVDRLHVGVLQFASNHKTERLITNDLGAVVTSVKEMTQLGGGTSFAGPLRECQKLLTEYTAAGAQTFDLCILITDGNSDESNAQLQQMNLLASSTKLMGIYVGNNAQSSDKLHELTSCTTPTSQQCPFFESAADFALLKKRAKDLAEGVTTGLTSEVTERVITYKCDAPVWTLCGLGLCIPFLLWWSYLHCPRPRPSVPAAKKQSKDPVRLATAGANEDRKV